MISVADIEARCRDHGITLADFWQRLRRLKREPAGWPTVSALAAASEHARDGGDQALAEDYERQAEAMRKRLERGDGR